MLVPTLWCGDINVYALRVVIINDNVNGGQIFPGCPRMYLYGCYMGDLSNFLSVPCYLVRWECDESYRYIKQIYNLEDIRVRSYIGIRNCSRTCLGGIILCIGLYRSEHKA